MEKLFFILLGLGAISLAIYLVWKHNQKPTATGAPGQTLGGAVEPTLKSVETAIKTDVQNLEKKL